MNNPPSQPRINYDVLLVILTFCDRVTISRMSRTCSTLHVRSPRLLLEDPVTIANRGALSSLYHYLVPHGPSRIRFLHSLKLRIGGIPVRLAVLLVAIFNQCTHLETLELLDAERLLKSHDPAIGHSIAQLTTLRGISLRGSSIRAGALLKRLQSPLVAVDFMYHDAFHRIVAFEEYHPLRLCKAFRSTLEALRTRFPPLIRNVDPQAAYPNLRWLEIIDDDDPFVGACILACPNIRELTVRTRPWYSGELGRHRTPFIDNEVELLRRDNRICQKVFGSWTQLHKCSGSLVALHLASLTCHIPRLEIDKIRYLEHVKLLRPMMRKARPTELRLVLEDATTFFVDGENSLATVFRRAGASVKKLELVVNPSPREDEFGFALDIGALADRVLETAACLRQLDSLKVEIEVPAPGPFGTSAPFCPAEISLESFDPQDFVDRALVIIPPLMNVKVDAWRTRDHIRKFAEVEAEMVDTE